MRRILVYFALMVVGAAVLTIYRGDRVTAANVAIAIPLALLFAWLIWLRWDVAPRLGRERRERERRQRADTKAD